MGLIDGVVVNKWPETSGEIVLSIGKDLGCHGSREAGIDRQSCLPVSYSTTQYRFSAFAYFEMGRATSGQSFGVDKD